jgi:hypothetical protein
MPGVFFRRLEGSALELLTRRQDGSEFPAKISLSLLDTDEGSSFTIYPSYVMFRNEMGMLDVGRS